MTNDRRAIDVSALSSIAGAPTNAKPNSDRSAASLVEVISQERQAQ